MSDQLPQEIEECIKQGALRLGRALEVLEWPSGGKDAPCHEINALISIAFYLGSLPNPFHLYAESSVNQRCRVDMIGFDGQTAIAMEAKGFGPINSQADSMLKDLVRLKTFVPSLSELAGNEKAVEWWANAESRWGIILISSFRGRKIRDAWMSPDVNKFIEIMGPSRSGKTQVGEGGDSTGFLALFSAVPYEYRRASMITDAKRWGSGEGWLIWAAIPLPAVVAAA